MGDYLEWWLAQHISGFIYDLTKLEQRETSGYWVTSGKEKMLHNHSRAHLNETEPLKKSALCNLLVALYDDNTSHEAFFCVCCQSLEIYEARIFI